ncbi:hypothetical protein HDU67_007922 [Dinochytrium kinnereticum]|nr:hypothetical protein HDU67_007922 [Dinochytrium kinnereticum]
MDGLLMSSNSSQPANAATRYAATLDQDFGGGAVNISGPLALGGGFGQVQRRPTNFSLPQNNISLAAMPTAPSPAFAQRRPSGSDAPIITPTPAPSVPTLSTGSSPPMEVGLPVPNKPSNTPVKSLFQSCMSLIEKLYGFPLFEFYLFPDGIEMYQTDPPPLIDPVAILWGCFRLGAPLCMLYNQLSPRTPLNVSDVSAIRPPKYTNVCKDNVYHFIVACKNDLGLSEKDVFTISELYKDDTNVFVKVLKTVDILMEKIEGKGLLPRSQPLPFHVPHQDVEAPTDNRSKLINEMIDTERKYINDLESLQNFKKEAIHQNVLSKDEAHSIFANLDELLDFQRRFLIAMESTLSLPPNEQRIGQLFSLNRLSHMITPHMLQSFLIKPVQRVCRYPLLLQELVKLSQNIGYPYLDELKEGLEAIKRVTERVNEQKRVEENRQLKNELAEKVEDWKGLKPEDFGSLLISDRFLMTSNDVEKEFNLYLFERILLCCKDLRKSKKKSKKAQDKEGSLYSLKGNIYVNSISAVQDTSDPSIGVFGLKVFWKDVVEVETFTLKCRNEEQVKMWKERLEKQVEADKVRKRAGSLDSLANPPGFMQSFRGPGSMDDHPDSAYAASSYYRPSLDASVSSPASSQYSSPPIVRSRSIPHNYYPMQYAPQQPLFQSHSVSANPTLSQRQSHVLMSRGFGSHTELTATSYNNAAAVPRALSASPDSSSRQPRSFSPPPPVPPIPQHVLPPHGRYAQDPQGTKEPMQMSPRQLTQGSMNRHGVSSSPQAVRSGGHGIANHSPNRIYSTTAPALAVASAVRTGFSDDEDFSDEEYLSMQQKSRHQQTSYARMNPSPIPQGSSNFRRANTTSRTAASGTPPSINTVRKQSLHSDDERSAFFIGRSNTTHFSPTTHPPVPPIPQGYFGSGVPLGRTPSGPESGTIGGMAGAPTSLSPSHFLQGQAQQQQYRGAFPASTKAPSVANPYQPTLPDLQGFISNRFPGNSLPSSVTVPPSDMYSHSTVTPGKALSPHTVDSLPASFSSLSTKDPASIGSPPAVTAKGIVGPSGVMAGFIKVRTHYESDIFVIAIPSKGSSYAELQARIERKIRLCGGKSPADLGRRIRIRYMDDDGDMIGLNGDEDVSMAFEMARKMGGDSVVLNLFVH